MRKVLIVDDEPTIAALIAAIVESELGFAPIVAYNEETALECLAGFDFALVISDTLSFRPYQSAERGGDRWAWLDYLREQVQTINPKTPLLMMTAYPIDLYSDFVTHGYKSCLSKPFNVSDFAGQLGRLLSLLPNQDYQPKPTNLLLHSTARSFRLEPNLPSQMAV